MQLRTEIEIDAPPDKVWAVLSDFPSYHEWNPFITSIEGKLAVGASLALRVCPPESSETRLEPTVLVCDPAQELRWRGHLVIRGLLDGEHFFRLEQAANGHTKFVHGEDFSGLLLRFLGQKLTHVARGFVYMNQALKRRVEGGG